MSMAILALIALVLTIVVGTWKKINIGIMGIIAACILSLIAKISIRELASGFGSQLFLRLLALQLMVCIAQSNGTMSVLANKIIDVGCRRSVRMFPIVMYILLVACTVCGLNVTLLVPPFLLAIAFEMKLDPMKFFFPYAMALMAVATSPLNLSGANLMSYAEESGLMVNGWNVPAIGMITGTIMFVFCYFFFGWNKQENVMIKGVEKVSFNTKQIVTLLGFVVYALLTLVFQLDIIITASIIAFILFMLNVADPKKVINALPWNILIMISGMSVLSNVVVIMGGVELLSNMISTMPIVWLKTPLMLLTASVMSFFSSGNGVVIPTLTPTIPGIVAAGAVGQETALVAAVGLGAQTTALSPMSTIGGNWMSCYDSAFRPSEDERQKLFNRQLVFVLASLVIQMVFCLLGLYRVNPF